MCVTVIPIRLIFFNYKNNFFEFFDDNCVNRVSTWICMCVSVTTRCLLELGLFLLIISFEGDDLSYFGYRYTDNKLSPTNVNVCSFC